MDETNVLNAIILQKLVRANMWGGKHTPLDFIKKGIPEHYKNTHRGQKILDKTLKELTNNEWIFLLSKKTGKGSDEHISLNPRKVAEIKQFLEKVTIAWMHTLDYR
ncbi:hypothetical protein HY486_01795 [Candidatus Woesearchaeota archaeon]|nr:hypothetical protein [Candidatus Woesearchaeota archaeon]